MKWFWAALGLTACTAVAPAPPSADLPPAVLPPPAAEPALALRFAWPAQGSVRVRETVSRKGHTAEVAYELAWAPHPEGGFVLEQRDRRWTAIDGVALTEEPTPAQLAAAGLSESVHPRLWIGADGRLQELLDLAAIAEPVVRQAQANPALSDAERQEIATAMQSPAALEMLGAATRQKWQCWVGAWIGAEIAPGATAIREEQLPILQIGSAQARVTMRAQAPEPIEGAVLIRLSLDTVFDPESLAAAARAVPARALTAQAQALQQEMVANLGRIERQEHVELLTDPATLMPRQALRRTAMEVFDKKGASLGAQTEEFLYVFEWPAD